jgi:hypothetical protein
MVADKWFSVDEVAGRTDEQLARRTAAAHCPDLSRWRLRDGR